MACVGSSRGDGVGCNSRTRDLEQGQVGTALCGHCTLHVPRANTERVSTSVRARPSASTVRVRAHRTVRVLAEREHFSQCEHVLRASTRRCEHCRVRAPLTVRAPSQCSHCELALSQCEPCHSSSTCHSASTAHGASTFAVQALAQCEHYSMCEHCHRASTAHGASATHSESTPIVGAFFTVRALLAVRALLTVRVLLTVRALLRVRSLAQCEHIHGASTMQCEHFT